MSTNSVSVVSAVAKVVTPGPISTFLKAHERLILVLSLAGLLLFGYMKGLTYLTAHDQLVVNKTQIALQSQIDANKKVADQAQQTAVQYQQLVQQLIASNNQIAAAQVQRSQATQKQQTIDKTLAPADLANRWTTLLKVSASDVVPTSTGYAVNPEAAVETAIQLEEIPKLQADLQGEQDLVANDGRQIDGLNGVVSSLHTQVDGLNSQIGDQSKAFVAQVNLMKNQARKSKLKWFFVGYVAGFVSREIIKP